MKIAVMAGTPIDTKMGEALLLKYQIHVDKTIFISNTPEEQNFFQTMNANEQHQIIRHYFEQLQNNNIKVLFVYCNSLSATIDFDKWGQDYKIVVITPLKVYRQLAQSYNNLVLLTANAQGASGIERIMTQQHPQLSLLTISMIQLVNNIEQQRPVQDIVNNLHLMKLLDFINAYQPQAIIIGCTHFPYILSGIKQLTNVAIIDPSEQMVTLLQAYLNRNDK